ncbi:tyrosine-type recombinase/integrase [Streptomyces sp. NPDC057927]
MLERLGVNLNNIEADMLLFDVCERMQNSLSGQASVRLPRSCLADIFVQFEGVQTHSSMCGIVVESTGYVELVVYDFGRYGPGLFRLKKTARVENERICSHEVVKPPVLAPSTFATPWNVCTSILKMAHQEGIIPKYPWEGLKPPEVFYPEIHPLHPEAVKALIVTASPRYRALVRQAASTGLRQGELFGLEDEEPAETVTVKQQLIGPDKGVPYLGEPKTRQSYRSVPQGRSVIDAIARHRGEFPAQVVYIEDWTNPRKPVWRHARLLYTSETGAAIRRGSWAKVWARNVKRANAHLKKSGSKVRVPEGTTLHDLRHFYASVLIKNGATPKQVQKRLGHAKPSITLNVYTHLWEAEEDRTASMMEAALS